MHLFIMIFSAISISHLILIILKKQTIKHITKILIVPSLLAVYIAGAGTPLLFPVLALVFGWTGDILLTRIGKRNFFILGLASFLLGHLCYILTFTGITGMPGFGSAGTGLNIAAWLIFSPQAVVLGIIVFRLIKPAKEMFVPVILYMAVLLAMGLTGFQVFLASPGLAGLLIISGAFNFMISDTILAYYTFRKPKTSGSVLIMAFYILAQAEIVMGLLML